MNFSFKKFTESPLFLLCVTIDVITNLIDKSYKVLDKKVTMATLLSEIDWGKTYDVIIRLVLTFIVWKLYKNFNQFKEKTELRERILNDKIKALNKINKNANDTINTLFIETRDRINLGFDYIVKSLNKLGDNTISTRQESEEILMYKNKINEKLDEQEYELYKLIDDNTHF